MKSIEFILETRAFIQNPVYYISVGQSNILRLKNLVPMIEGRSSIGRLGIYIHVTAGFGDIGFSGYWTLEISVVQPVIIYPFVRIAQIYYHEIRGIYLNIKANIKTIRLYRSRCYGEILNEFS